MRIPFGPIGYFTYKRTYSRKLDDNSPNSPTEEFPQTIDRALDACETQLKCGFSAGERREFRQYLMQLKGSMAGRFLWQLGTTTVDRLGLFSLQNCAFTLVNEPIAPFTWVFDALMLGSGVGYNIQKEYVYELPKVKAATIVRKDANDADFIVPDSREGWVKLLEQVLTAHFFTGKGFSFSTVCVRGKGAPIKGFGGTASGPEELCWGMAEISKIFNLRAGKKLRPIDVLDIMNIIGFVVVSGNVRRSAQIAIGDADDPLFMNAKRWDLGNVPNWRAMSNNSAACNNFSHLSESFWEGYKGNGEAYGLINLKLARKMGRLGDTRYTDPEVAGVNPCAEQFLAPYETCCLAEIFLPNITSQDELNQVATYLYRVCKHSLALPCHQPETEKVVHKNMRMGIGVTGDLQATDEQRSWLSNTYEHLREYDKKYSKKHGWPESIKLTTCKPSGTLSLLPGVTPGIHPGYSRFFIRRVRVASNSTLVELCRNHGYPVEFQRNFDGTDDKNTVIVSFPCSFPEGTVVAKDVTAVQQLEYVTRMQRNWSDNAVSCTVYYKKEELPEIREWLKKNYNSSIKSVSFLLHSEHGFAQAPYEEIDEATYLEMKSKVKEIESGVGGSFDDVLDNMDCATGACPVR
jgi:ribonucleoside-triphosphate reductase (thioredoxin)